MEGIISSGCTVAVSFDLDDELDLDDVDGLYVTFKQGQTTIEKKKADIEVETVGGISTLTCNLTQADTVKFNDRHGMIKIQIRIKYSDGSVTKSNVMVAGTDELLKQGVI